MKKLYTICFILYVLVQGYGQQDSLLKVLSNNPESVEVVDQIQDYFNRTYYQNPKTSLQLAKATDSLAQVHKMKSKYGITQLMLGIAYNINEKYDRAITAFLNAVDYAQTLKTPKTEAQAYNGLAVVWQVRKDTETSALYFEKALEIYNSLNDTLWVGLINLNLGGLYMEDDLLDKADDYLVEAILAMDKMNQPIYAGYGKLNLGSLRVKQEKYKEAITHLEEALQVVPYQVNPLIHAVGNTALGESYLRQNRIVKSKEYLDLALSQSQSVKNYEQLEVVNGLLSEYYELSGNNKEALSYYKVATSFRDSFISKEEDERLIDALKKYEAEKKEQEIMLLSAENEFKDLRNQRDRRNLIFAVLGLVALGIITGLIFANRNRFLRLSRELEEQKTIISTNLEEKELLLKEIHHRVKNNLQVISSLLSLQSNYVQSDSAVQALSLGRDRIKSMGLIHQNLYQEGNLTGVKLQSYFENLCKNLMSSYSVDPEKVKLELQIEDLDLEVDHVIPLGLIANELISNTLKHGFITRETGLVKVSLRRQKNNFHFSVADNGSGVSAEKLQNQSNTFGYKMIHAFKEKLDADLLITNKNGLKVELIFDPSKS